MALVFALALTGAVVAPDTSATPAPVHSASVTATAPVAAVRNSADNSITADAADDSNGFDDTGPTVTTEVIDAVTMSVGMVHSAGVNGTGWIAEQDTVVTNLHVARAGSGNIFFEFSDGEVIECYSAVADRSMDLAVVRCDTGSRPTIGIDVEIPDADTPVAVVGYPGGEGPTVTTGMITGERIVNRGIETVRFTAPIQPGSSGSPVFDSRGNVRAVATFSGGLGVPIAQLKPLLKVARGYPATKEGAEWRLRIRRSALVGTVTLLVAWFFARRYGRNDPWRVAIRWTVIMILVTLALTQLLFAARGPASFI